MYLLRLMLVGVWLGLLWVLFYFFDHYIQSSVHACPRRIWSVLYWVLFSFFDRYHQSSVQFHACPVLYKSFHLEEQNDTISFERFLGLTCEHACPLARVVFLVPPAQAVGATGENAGTDELDGHAKKISPGATTITDACKDEAWVASITKAITGKQDPPPPPFFFLFFFGLVGGGEARTIPRDASTVSAMLHWRQLHLLRVAVAVFALQWL